MSPTVDADFNAKMRTARIGIAAGESDAFAPRVSGLPIGTFSDPLEWCTRKRVRWGAIAVLIAACVLLAWLGDGGIASY